MSGDNDFIEPPPWLTGASQSPKGADSDGRPDDPATVEELIILPPGLVDSATFTLPPERHHAPPARAPEVVFFPAAPGAAAAAPDPVDSFESHLELLDATVHVSRPQRSWRLSMQGSPPVVVEGILFLGRNPSPPSPHRGAPALAVIDPTKSVSKTHAMLEIDEGELWVHDLESTNGVWVLAQGTDAVEVVVGSRCRVPAGSTIELGDFVVGVERL